MKPNLMINFCLIPRMLFTNTGTISYNKFVFASQRSHSNHPEIPGFEYSYGNINPMIESEPTGYFYYDIDVYFSSFTSNSRLYLIHVGCNFTPGKQGYVNGDHGYDKNYGLYEGYIHIKAYQTTDGDKKSPSYKFIKSWPISDSKDRTATVTTSFGGSISLSKSIKAGVDFTDAATIEAVKQGGFTLNFSKSLSITQKEPMVSHQLGRDFRESQWHYQFKKGLYDSSYSLDTYYLFELKNDGKGYQNYSFKYDLDISRTNTAWESYPWAQYRTTEKVFNDSYGLY